MPICFRLFVHWIRRAASRAAWTAGNSRAISTAMMAMTTRSSISVKPRPRIERLEGRGMAGGPETREERGRSAGGPLVHGHRLVLTQAKYYPKTSHDSHYHPIHNAIRPKPR